MGGFAARKALDVVENVEIVIAVELLAACQALDLRRPLKYVVIYYMCVMPNSLTTIQYIIYLEQLDLWRRFMNV